MSISIEEQVVKNYQENISYLKEQQPELFDKIIAFESAIENGHYQPRYELEYKDEGYFDVKELSTDNYFYSANSNEFAKKTLKIVNFKKNESTFKTFYDYHFNPADIKRLEQENIASNCYYAYSKIMQYTKSVQPKDPYMKEIKKFIFFGVGLGTHIKKIDEKIKAENYLFVEDDLELFRLSLFTVNYADISKHAKLFFAVFEDDNEARKIYEKFLEKSFYYNHYIKYFQMHSCSDKKVKAMQMEIASQRHLVYFYHHYFQMYLRALDYIKDGYNFIDMSRKDIDQDTFLGKPVMLVAAGPSLSKNIDWLAKNKDKFVIVALSATLSILEKHNIKPDIVTHIDPFEKTCMVHLDKVSNDDFYKDSILLCGSQTPKVLLDRFQKDKIFIAQINITYKKELSFISPICVGSATYMMLINLGVKDLYTLGLDLALDSKTGLTHSKDHAYAKKLNTEDLDELQDKLGYKKVAVKIKGNFQDEVFSKLDFQRSVNIINDFNSYAKQYFQNVYNLSDGAFLDGTTAKRVDEIDTKLYKKFDKKVFQKELVEQMIKKSSNKLTDSEKLSMKRRLNYVKELLSKLEKHRQPQGFNTILYKNQLLSIALDILEEHDSEAWDLHNIYLSYMNFILPFIFDMLNTKDLKNEKKHIKHIHKLFIRYTMEIAEYYLEHIEKFFNKEIKSSKKLLVEA